jgi:hypothetical protein
MLCGSVGSHEWWTGVTHTVADKPHGCVVLSFQHQPVTRKVTQAVARIAITTRFAIPHTLRVSSAPSRRGWHG